VNDSRERLVRILRKTLEQMEQDPQIASDDPAVTELKRSLLHRIADLEVRHATEDFDIRRSTENGKI
jgi:hypothetical protein